MRDYSMTGKDAQNAIASGLAAAEWYHTSVERKEMKALMQRSDQPAMRDCFILFGAMIAFATGGIWLWGSWWCVPFWFAYGTLYGSAMDSRWHECGHGSAFKTRRYNEYIYQIASFCMIRNPTEWKWSHTRHHTNTIIVGRDPEIAIMRPPELFKLILNFVGIFDSYHGFCHMIAFGFGRLNNDVKDFVPEQEQPKIIRTARIWMAIYGLTILSALALGSWIPFMLIGLPRIYGAWHMVMCGLLQHGGLAENVIDHRLNSRTVYMNPVSRFIYWNMNYHVEHHMFPMVPYHALPALHEKIKYDLPAPNPSIASGFREMWPAIKRQIRNDDYFIKRELPATAKPYREDYHQYIPQN